jgi:hypothetical protein
MMEVRNLRPDETQPSGPAWVLIEKIGDKYAVRGQANHKAVDASFAPSDFDTAEVAIKASVAWADLLGIPLLYVKDGQ